MLRTSRSRTGLAGLTVLVAATLGATLLPAAAAPAAPAAPAAVAAPAAAPVAPALLNPPTDTSGVVVYPTPGARFVGARTEISFRGVRARDVKLSVRGSLSGIRKGQIRPHSDGKGASWVPLDPFRAKETVTVTTGLKVVGKRGTSFQYTIADALNFPTDPIPTAPGAPAQVSYRSTDLKPFATTTVTPAKGTVPGLTFTAPFGPAGVNGMQIMDDNEQVVYFQPTDKKIFDFKVQTYQGKKVLTWFEGDVVLPGLGRGSYVIADTSYQVIKRFPVLGGLTSDLHELTLTPQGTAMAFSYNPVYVDARSVGGVRDTRVLDNVIQEIDLASGRLLFEWHSLDHVGLAESYLPAPTENRSYWDFTHVNSVKKYGDNAFIASFRSTHAILNIDRRTGKINWQVGGKRATYKLIGTTPFSSQHDAVLRADGVLTMFDNGLGAGDATNTTSRGLLLKLDTKKRTATFVREFKPPMDLLAQSQGSLQSTARGFLVGFGNLGNYAEFAADGTLLHQVRFTQRGVQSYRVYKADWKATPSTVPSVAAARDDQGVAVFASWNGATEVASWRVLGGSSSGALSPQGTAGRSGFETTLRAAPGTAFAAVQALDAAGAVLATSPTVAVG